MKPEELVNNPEYLRNFITEVYKVFHPNEEISDVTINHILNDKENQARYLKANKIIESHQKAEEIAGKYHQLYGTPNAEGKLFVDFKNMSRTWVAHLKTDGSPESEKANDEYVKSLLDPKTRREIAYDSLDNLLKMDKSKFLFTNPDDALNFQDNPENFALCNDAFNLAHMVPTDMMGEDLARLVQRQKTVIESANSSTAYVDAHISPYALLYGYISDEEIRNGIVDTEKVHALKAIEEKYADIFPDPAKQGFGAIGSLKMRDVMDVAFVNNFKNAVEKYNMDPTLNNVKFIEDGKEIDIADGISKLAEGKDIQIETLSKEELTRNSETLRDSERLIEMRDAFYADLMHQKQIENAYKEDEPSTILPAKIAELKYSGMLNNFLHAVNDRLTLETMQNVCEGKGVNVRYYELIATGLKNGLDEKEITDPEIKRIRGLSEIRGKDLRYVNNFMKNNPEASDKIIAEMRTSLRYTIVNMTSFSKASEFEVFMKNFLTNTADAEKMNLFRSSDDTPIILDDGKEREEYPYKDAIEQLKTINPSSAEALDEANRILSVGSENGREALSPVAEHVGAAFDKALIKEAVQGLFRDEADNNIINRKDAILISNSTGEQKEKAIAKLFDGKDETSKETQEKLIGIYNYMVENNIISDQPIRAEQGGKIYSLANLMEKREAVKKAVEGKNIDDINNAVKEYQKTDAIYKGAYEKLADLNCNRISGNISAARESQVPQEYREDYLRTSQLNAIWIAGSTLKEQGVSFEETIKKPIETFKNLRDHYEKEGAIGTYLKNHTMAEIIKNLKNPLNGDMGEMMDTCRKECFQMGRTIDAIAQFSDNENIRSKLCVESMYISNSSTFFDKIIGSGTASFSASKETFKNFLAVEKEDIDFHKLIEGCENDLDYKTGKTIGKFDQFEYLASGNTTMAKLAERLIAANDDNQQAYYDQLDEAIKETARTACECESITRSEYTMDIMIKIAEGKIDDLTPADRMIVKAEADIQRELAENKVDTTIKSLADVQKEYDSRNFLQKWFGPKTRRMDDMIKMQKAEISQKFGIKTEDIEAKIKEALNPPANSLQPAVNESLKQETAPSRVKLEDVDSEFQKKIDEEVSDKDKTVGRDLIADDANKEISKEEISLK